MEYERKLRVVARLYRRHKIFGAPMSQDRTTPHPPPPPPGNFLRVIEYTKDKFSSQSGFRRKNISPSSKKSSPTPCEQRLIKINTGVIKFWGPRVPIFIMILDFGDPQYNSLCIVDSVPGTSSRKLVSHRSLKMLGDYKASSVSSIEYGHS